MPSQNTSKKEVLGWCFYDFGNSAFTTVIITAFYVLYFKNIVFADRPELGDLWWGIAISLSMLVVALSSPILGAIADSSGAKKRFLIAYSGLCILFTALLYFVGQGDYLTAILFFILANIGFEGAMVFYNAFLPEIAPRNRIGRVSGWGWSLGYIGGICCLLLILPLASHLKEGEAGVALARLSFPLVALFCLVAALPSLLLLKERAPARTLPPGVSYLREGFRHFTQTLRQLRRYRDLMKFLLAFFIYQDAIVTIIAFTASYADQTLHFTPKENLLLILMVNPAAALGAFVFGYVFDSLGGKRTITLTLIGWMAVVVFAYMAQSKGQFLAVGLVAGLLLGSTQSASRSLVALFSPPNQTAQFFGFYAVSGKFSAILGPLTFGVISYFTGSQRLAILGIGIFFLIGLLLLQRVNEREGILAATDGISRS